MEKQTRREFILTLFKVHATKLTCTEVTILVKVRENISNEDAHYLSGSISSLLASMVKNGELQYAEKLGPRGGHVYELKKQAAIPDQFKKLFKKRFVLINPWPDMNPYKWKLNKIYYGDFSKFKFNFKELSWGERRSIKDLPEYLRFEEKVFKAYYHPTNDFITLRNKVYESAIHKTSLNIYKPATEQEFINQKY